MLNSKQIQAVEHIKSPLMITAGPGTGKTQTIAHKISYLLDKGFNENSILALTFGEKAAEELSIRVKSIIKKEVEAKTFHSFAQEIIDEFSSFLPQITNKRKLIEESDSLYFFYENLDDFKISSIDIKNNREEVIYSLYHTVMKLKENGILLKDLEALEFEDLQTKIDILGVYAKYENYKKQNDFMDFTDLLILLLNLLEKNKEVSEKLKNRFSYILVDEFQDVNILQFKIINLLINKINLTVVGDPKQSIYGFRGADISNWNKLKETLENVEEIFLDENYRSEKKIIENINLIIDKEEEKLSSNLSDDGKVDLFECENEIAQEQFLIENIKKNSEEKIGILFRTSYELNSFSKKLELNQIKHDLVQGVNPFKVPLVKEVLELIQVINSPNESTIELFNLLQNSPIHKESIRLIMENLRYAKRSLYEFILEERIPLSVEREEKKFIINFVKELEILRKKNLYLSKLIDEIIFIFKLKKRPKDEDIIALEEVQNYVKHLEEVYDVLDLKKFLKLVSMSRNLNFFNSKEKESKTNISLLTYHQAKGKEFEHVFMPSLNERRFPLNFRRTLFETTYDFSKIDFLDEEKRLFFVGMSRAKKSLYLSYVYKFKENKTPSKSSVFLLPLNLTPKKYLEKQLKNTSEKNMKRKELEEKISRAVLLENFSLAKKHIDVLEKISKKDNTLNSFISTKQKSKFETLYSKETEEPVMFDTSKIVYSVSQLQTYESCPKKYLYQYVYKVPSKPKHYFDFGTSMHTVLELLLPKFNDEDSEENLYEIGLKLLKDKWISKAYESKKQEEDYLEKGKLALKAFINTEVKRKSKERELVQQEKRFKIELWGKSFVGVIDRIDNVAGEYEILDYKTSNSMELKSKMQENMQLNVYAQAIKNEFGKYPKSAGLWYLIHDKIEEIEIKEDSIDNVRKKVIDLCNGIESKDFKAKPSSFGCKFCDFNKICTQSKYNN